MIRFRGPAGRRPWASALPLAALAVLLLGCPAGAGDRSATPPSASADSAVVAALQGQSLEALAARLPEERRPWGDTLLHAVSEESRGLGGNRIATDTSPAVADFILAVLAREQSPRVIELTAMNVYATPHFHDDQRMRAVLRHIARSHPSAQAVTIALEQLRSLEMRALRNLVDGRVAAARAAGDTVLLEALTPVEDEWITLQRGWMLPTFLRTPPPVFQADGRSDRVRVVAFGDFGASQNREPQLAVAAAIRQAHRQRPFDFGITLGDNFYPEGLPSPTDDRWREQLEEPYGPMGIRIYPSLGNHDQYDGNSPPAEILYSQRSAVWTMPAQYYTYTAGPVQFFAIDGNDPSERQLRWLEEAIARSTAQWKVVYGHFPLFYTAARGFAEHEKLMRLLWPRIRGRVDLYLAGHHHSLQYIAPLDGVHFLVSGAGGASSYEVVADADPRIRFAQSVHGFAVLEFTPAAVAVSFIDRESRELYRTTITK